MLARRELDQYNEEDGTGAGEDSKRHESNVIGKLERISACSLSDEHFEHVSDVSTAKEIWSAILNVFERHTLLNKHAVSRMVYNVTTHAGEKIFPYLSQFE